MSNPKNPFSLIPKVDEMLADERIMAFNGPRRIVVEQVRACLDQLRDQIKKMTAEEKDNLVVCHDDLVAEILSASQKRLSYKLRRVINASGVVIHTNLGRSLMSESLAEHLSEVACRFTNLEFNLDNGKRGSRYDHIEEILCRLTGAESALVVNNNAAAVLLVLSTLAQGKKVVVSRGQLVEIGGAFRIPDVMRQSGCELVEVGTTNKTHLRDYEAVLDADTAAILKVHTSNYRILGFTSEVPIDALAGVAQQHSIPLIEDIGSGTLVDFSKYGLTKEPTVRESLEAGADVVTFSGDKMLGGPQAGIIVGKKCYIDQMKKNQLTRALRVDKMTFAALEGTLMLYLDEERALTEIPTLRMLTQSIEILEQKAKTLEALIKSEVQNVTVSLQPGESEVGGGSLPLEKLQTVLVVVKGTEQSVNTLSVKLREASIPVIARISEDALLLDPRTLMDDELPLVAQALAEICNG